MISRTLLNEIEAQHDRNLKRWGKQPRATLILEIEDQVGKLRDAFLHRTDNQVFRRLVNIGSLIWAIADELPEPWLPTRPGREEGGKVMIKNVLKAGNGMVLVFDEDGEQMPEYQGPYDKVKEAILRDAPPDAVFSHIISAIQAVPRGEW